VSPKLSAAAPAKAVTNTVFGIPAVTRLPLE